MSAYRHQHLFTAALIVSLTIVGLLLTLPMTRDPMLAASNTPTAAKSDAQPYTLFYIEYSYDKDNNVTAHYNLYVPGEATAREFNTQQVPPDFSLLRLTWSNAHQALLISNEDTSESELFTMTLRQPQSLVQLSFNRLTKNQNPHDAEWSPDGKYIAMLLGILAVNYDYLAVYLPNGHLHTITGFTVPDSNGDPTMLITNYQRDKITQPPEWSPDGKYLAYTLQHNDVSGGSAPTPSPDQIPPPESEGRIVNTDCLKQDTAPCAIAKLTPVTPYDYWANFQWLPDSQHLIFQCVRPSGLATPHPHAGNVNDLCTIRIDGSDLRHLYLADLPDRFQNYAISPDGTTLLYTTNNGVDIYDMSTGRVVDQLSAYLGPLVWLPAESARLLGPTMRIFPVSPAVATQAP